MHDLIFCIVSVAAHLKASGRMARDMDWERSTVVAGLIEENGLRDSKAGMACGRRQRLTPSTKALGRTDFRMDTARRRMLMEVR